MPTVLLSNPLSASYAEHLGLASRQYNIGESIIVDVQVSQFLEYVGYGTVTGTPASGAPILFGTGAPSAAVGVNGSYYLDTAAQKVYGPKVAGAWGAGTALASSTVLLGGLDILPSGPPGPPGPPGDDGADGTATNVQIRAAQDYDNATAPTTGAVVAWNGTKFYPKVLSASDVGAVTLTGAQTIAGVKTFSSSPVVPAPTVAGNPVRHDDTRLSDTRTPTAHAATHGSGGTDPVTPTAIGASPSTHSHSAAAIGAAAASHTHAVADIIIAGTPDGTKYLRDDGTWAVPPGSGGAAVTDATTAIKGIVRLAGDLGGTADTPTVPGLALKLDASEKGATNGVAPLVGGVIPNAYYKYATTTTDGSIVLAGDLGGTATAPTVPGLATKVATSRVITAGTGLTGGGDLSANRSLAVSFGTAAGTVAQGNDSRIVNAVQNGGGVATSVKITAAAFAALGTKDAATLYVVQG